MSSRGLSGKERKVRDRNRAERLFAHEMVEEYLEAPVRNEYRRPIRINHQSAFHPTAADARGEPAYVQLQFDLAESKVTGEETRRQAPTTNGTTRRPRPSHAEFGALLSVRERKPAPFSLRRFVYGCALGGAAAAVILLMLTTLF